MILSRYIAAIGGTMKNNPHSAGVTFRPSAVERATDSFPVVGARRLLPQEAQ